MFVDNPARFFRLAPPFRLSFIPARGAIVGRENAGTQTMQRSHFFIKLSGMNTCGTKD